MANFNTKKYSDAQFNSTVSKLRTYLRSVARKRASRIVTADDAHNFLDRQGIRPQQVRTRLAFINAVLRNPQFEAIGMSPSMRPAARGRMISEWTTN
jgi:hypothetical protein